jgi:arsenite-transporting ATPase
MLDITTPIVFFTGKGGVGKTSTACAVAVALADAGKRVLLVSTDPATNLDEVLGVELSAAKPVPIVHGLFAMNIDPEAAAAAYRERVVGPYRGVLPAAAIANIEEQLSGACTVEIAAFDQFAALLAQPVQARGFDHIIFDTAPTGHTLRLLELPEAWSGFFSANTSGTSCLGPLSGLEAERQTYAEALAALRDPARVRVVLVTRPEAASTREAARTADELSALGITGLSLVVNGVFTATDPSDPIAAAMSRRAAEALASLPAQLASLERLDVRLQARAPMGVDGLRAFTRGHARAAATPDAAATDAADAADAATDAAAAALAAPTAPWSLTALIDALEAPRRGVILTMGKGGVGKTTVAATIACALADRGHRVHLTTTDPAAHILDAAHSGLGLTVGCIDPRAETARYTAHVMATAGATLDDAGRALLAEELRSPCTEEVAVFQAFARVVAEGEDRFVVIDTAPTGHTLLLLDAAEAYHREVLKKPGGASDAVRALLPRLRDPDFARALLVTLPEATPVHEAAHLQRDLERAQIHPFAWVINQTLTGLSVTDPVLVERQQREQRFIAEASALAPRRALSPWRADPTPSRAPSTTAPDTAAATQRQEQTTNGHI